MDDFVRTKLTEWGLSKFIDIFQEHEIDKDSLYCLEDEEIDQLIKSLGPKAKFKKNLRLLKQGEESRDEQEGSFYVQNPEKADSAQDLPSTSDKGKRKLNPQSETSFDQSPAKRRITELGEGITLHKVKSIMGFVNQRLEKQDNTQLNAFLRSRISDLETDKRELVGVFGKTGAGKSSLINAVIDEMELLPSGRGRACTSVMIQVEANRHNSKYVGEIEFISKEEWKDEVWSLIQFLGDNADQKTEDEDDNDDDYERNYDDSDGDDKSYDSSEKLSAVYGEEWKNKSHENLMDARYFREISEFLNSKKKILTSESAQDLSAKLVKYTRSVGSKGEKLYWPLVKCVTIKVPNNDLLQHVTLVDLPGNGDRNKSRDKMWKEIVGSCSTVWIVTEMTLAVSETESWDILKSAINLIGNGGECRNIHIICTKSDQIGISKVPADEVPAFILRESMKTKEIMKKELSKQFKIKKHFDEECFKVYTVSSKEFLKPEKLQPEDTEIPKLQEFLKDLNDSHSVTLNFVSGAFGILSLIQGACGSKDDDQRNNVCRELETNLNNQLDQVKSSMEEAYKSFDRSLAEGVEKSKISCEGKLNSVLNPKRKSGRGFHRTLKCVVENGGIYKPKKGKEINLNMTLSSCLTDSIDEDFRKTFPNNIKAGPFNGAIGKVSLDIESLIEKNKDLELLLRFLKTEEDKIKSKMNKLIRDRKKTIYRSLTETIENSMQEGYGRAATFQGKDKLKNMRVTVATHFDHSKNSMFDEAKEKMLTLLKELKVEILKTIEETMMKALELSLKNDDRSIQDVSRELKMVKEHLDQLKNHS